eukprot:628378-Prymnesium_polylepis.1
MQERLDAIAERARLGAAAHLGWSGSGLAGRTAGRRAAACGPCSRPPSSRRSRSWRCTRERSRASARPAGRRCSRERRRCR